MAVEQDIQLGMRSGAGLLVLGSGLWLAWSSCVNDGTQTVVCSNSGIRCPAGWTCTAAQDGCTDDLCGNLVVDPGEECDDGNIRDDDKCNTDCRTNFCGDGRKRGQEQCDDGNGTGAVDTIFCDADCTYRECGDKYINTASGMVAGVELPPEACEDWPVGTMRREDTATCNAHNCTRPLCGDGHINRAAGEECDEWSAGTPRKDTARCDQDCTAPRCGDGHLNLAAGEQCEEAADCAPAGLQCNNCQCTF